jgi:two-component system, NtrC family, sensor kinase
VRLSTLGPMDKDRRPGITGKVLIAVSVTAAFFLAAGLVLGLWSAGELREVVGDQFNEQQLVIARHVSVLIERQLQSVKKELLLLKEQLPDAGFEPEAMQEAVQRTFRRVLESGVWKIEILDLDARKGFTFMPFSHWATGDLPSEKLEIPLPHDEPAEGGVWVTEPKIERHGISLFLLTPLQEKNTSFLLFDLNVSWFLNPVLGDIRSGKTGYAWLIDGEGRFLYHPNAEFIGKPAIEIREEAYQGVPLGMIAFIQREKMLQGQEGTGWFFSGWHRGITGKIKKLIAYSPIILSRKPFQIWSVAVVAPISEIEDSVQRAYLRQFFLQGLVIFAILVGAGAVLFFEMRWSRTLEARVNKRTEELKKSEEKYRSLVESAEDFIFTVDGEGCFQSMNSFTASFFGGRAEEFLGKGLQTLFPEKVAQEQLRLVKLVLKAGKSVRDEFEIDLAGHKTWISANFMPLKNEQGEVGAVLCIARDITENKNLERQLINAEKLASIGTLAAGVAHEVNNPLGVILGFCDLLLRKKDKDSQEYEDLKTIERQGLHCKEVVENLLSFARLGQGDGKHADVNQCLEDIIKVVRHTLEMHDIDLELLLMDGMPPVQGDPRQLQQVFLNLVTNAVSAMPSGGTLKVRTYMERASRKAVITIEDEGTGIKEEHMDRIFEPFFTTKPEGEGTGLGLFVSYGIITKFGGTIDCASRQATPAKAGGTTFTIKLLTQS